MKKNGFTLPELLAVIIILGILTAVAVTGVSQYLDKSKKQAFTTLEKNIKVAANDYFIDHSSMIPEIGGSRTIAARVFMDENYLDSFEDPDSTGYNCDLDNSYVTVTRGGNQEDFNMTLDYKICVKCSRLKSSDC